MKIFTLLLAAVLVNSVHADTPLPPPKKLKICSTFKKLCAISDPVKNVTFLLTNVSGQKPWKIAGWHQWMFLSDDGESAVIGYAGMNLLPQDVQFSEPVLFFYNRGKLVRTVKLDELYRSKSQLRRTVSHFAWVNQLGFNDAHQFVIELVNGNKVAFAARTGDVEPIQLDGK
jgi:hypothetical protein